MEPLHISEQAITQMDPRRRAAFMNSLTGFKSASLIGTVDGQGHTNLAIFSSVTHLGSSPALIGFINRPDSVDRHTLENILDTRYYTINHIHQEIYQQAHQTSARYDKAVSEFDAVGLTPEWSNDHPAPFVRECHIKYGMEYVESHRLEVNGTILVIGKVVSVLVPETCIRADGSIDVEQAGTITISGLDRYHVTNRLARLSYAKPDKSPAVLDEK